MTVVDSFLHPERRALLPSASTEKKLSPDKDGSLLGSCLRPLHRLCSCAYLQRTIPSVKSNEEEKAVEGTSSTTWTQTAKYAISVTLLGVCIALCTAGILARQTPVAADTNPAVALVLMWVLMWWLGILEGGQGCLVGLQPVDPAQFQHSHPYTYACTQLAHKGDNLNRFIVGRQFFVVLVVFLLNLVCTVVVDFDVPGAPHALMAGLVASGLAVMIITVMIGQLAAEVNATNCMFDFVNSRIVWVTTVMCLVIEASGLLHSVYLVKCFFSTETNSEDSANKTLGERLWYWTRMVFSVGFLFAALAVTCDALWHGETTMYPGLTTIASFAVFFGLVCFLGLLEAIQIAAFAVVKLPPDVVAKNAAADANCRLVFRGRNFKAVLIGRQICVTTSMFLLARITTTNVDPGDLVDTSTTMSTVLGVPAAIQDFFNTGLPGALITTIVASLWWRILAASFPIAFMANPVVHWTIRLCLCLEATGIFSAAWLLADGIKWMMGLKSDDVYLTSKEITEDEMELGKSDSSTLLTQRSSDSDDTIGSLSRTSSDEFSI